MFSGKSKMSPMSEISSTISSTSTTAQRRKIKKPLIEKRRRMRINQCLANLKSLVLEATNKDENCFPKMEKADILEMTVTYMKSMKHRPSISGSAPVDSSDHMYTYPYLSGFKECAVQVCSFLMDESKMAMDGAELRGQLTRHLSSCFQKIQLELQHPSERPGAHSTALHSRLEPANENKVFAEDIRCSSSSCHSPASSSSSSSSSASPVPLLPPLTILPSPTFKAEASKRCSVSTGAPLPISRLLERSSTVKSPSRTSGKLSNPVPVSTSAVASARSTVPFQLGTPSFQIHQHHHHHPDLFTPKQATEFPLSTMPLIPLAPFTAGQNQSTVNPAVVIRDPLPVLESFSSAVWRPW